MVSRAEIIEIVKEQLAVERNCSPGDFDKSENIITLQGLSEKRRKFSDKPFFLTMTTMGGNAVISADQRMHGWLANFVRDKTGHSLFEYANLREIDTRLEIYGKQLFQTHHMFLPLGDSKPQMAELRVKWFEQEEIWQFYEGKNYPNALGKAYTPERPDMLAIAAMDGAKIIGMAGCSADTLLLWQIGVDVGDGYRGKGIGTRLVSLLKDAIISRGKIPYYGASLSNIPSWKVALKCGFTPAWIDTETMEW